MSRSSEGGAEPLRVRPPRGWEGLDVASIAEGMLQLTSGRDGEVDAYFERCRSFEWVKESSSPRVRDLEEEGIALRWRRSQELRAVSIDGITSVALKAAFEELFPGSDLNGVFPPWELLPSLAVPRRKLQELPRQIEAALRRRWFGLHYHLRLRWFRRELLVVGGRWIAGPEREEFVACELEREGRTRTWILPELPDPEEVARALLEDLRYDGASAPPPGRYRVWLSPSASAVLLHETLGHLREADLRDAPAPVRGQRCGRTDLFALEDPTAAPTGTERLSDDEGSVCRAQWLLREGRFEGWLADRQTAELWPDLQPGNGFRSSRHDPVLPRTYCLRLLPGTAAVSELERAAAGGLAILQLQRGTVQPRDGRLRLEVSAARELGAEGFGAPLGGFELQGTSQELLSAIVAVGAEVEMVGGWCAKHGQRRPVWVEAPALVLDGVEVIA